MYLMIVSLDRIGALSTLIVLSCYFLCGCLMFWSVFCLSERMTRRTLSSLGQCNHAVRTWCILEVVSGRHGSSL